MLGVKITHPLDVRLQIDIDAEKTVSFEPGPGATAGQGVNLARESRR
jgi:hypothetical protein